jgi:ATP-dependent Lon protease
MERGAMINKLRERFDEMVVFKDLKTSNFFSALSLPSFMRDWLLSRFGDDSGAIDTDEFIEFIREYIPRKEEWTAIKDRIIKENERVKILAKITVEIDIRTGEVSFSLPDFGLSSKQTIIEDENWNGFKNELIKGREVWGMLELGYRPPNDNASTKIPGKIRLLGFKNFCPYIIDIDYYKDVRSDFTISEWIDILLGAVDYNANGYKNEEEKLTVLTRLLPFVEKRLNLIELAPKGTGKSYLYGQISRFGTIQTGAAISRAKMFYDRNRRAEGFIFGHDFVVIDEVNKAEFTNINEMQMALQGYLESGRITLDNFDSVADAGVVLCGNILKDIMDSDGTISMFTELPKGFHESALIDRFHGFIKGWNIPRMNDDLKISSWALNSEYFCAILHELRSDSTYRAIVDKLVIVPEGADTRDTEAIKRISTAYLKLLFPNVRKTTDISARDFNRYCLRRASTMRSTIKMQLGILDTEFRGKDIPQLTIREQTDEKS